MGGVDGSTMIYIHSWSGGKDSTAAIILDHIHNLPPSKVIFSEVMFDKKRGISGESPEHIAWMYDTAIPKLKKWGYEVNVLRADKDYFDLFNHVVTKSKMPERNGKKQGFLYVGNAGGCAANSQLKVKPINDCLKQFKGQEITHYIGIAIDEPKRLAKLKEGRTSLLARYGYTEQMAYDLCKKYGLLSPIYATQTRGGCWFCPNARYSELAQTKRCHPELWTELEKLSKVEDVVCRGFKYGKTFAEVDKKIDEYIERQRLAALQISLFDKENRNGTRIS